ncbi:Zinc finger CCHC-type domain-containing protein [Penicillium ucsense]|uniref:Zinc finger CCHC-type domain-containing protein n=1 Tax=Penicillium ucsense TaxID=2839758 RepID=A0A8J8VY19_9EURO|nr:Zinc finger CCHC-type domain-containing protein [Penicillium ucsense]KAF7733252.1 Zinc finger CCHC-type domain-containing protein [Penicillium ucsense]
MAMAMISALEAYSKAVPDATFVDIEKRLRAEKCGLFLIAQTFRTSEDSTLIDLQGRVNCTFRVGWFKSPEQDRPFLKGMWPKDAEHNLSRLEEAGFECPSYRRECDHCGGHVSEDCRFITGEHDLQEIKCPNCGLAGHRLRDCKSARVCRECGVGGHTTIACPKRGNQARGQQTGGEETGGVESKEKKEKEESKDEGPRVGILIDLDSDDEGQDKK